MFGRGLILAVLLIFVGSDVVVSQELSNSYQEFIKKRALELRKNDHPAASIEEWMRRRSELRENLFDALGRFPEKDCDLEGRVLGGFQRDGYRLERVVFQTRPGVWMTANAYVPDRPGKHAAILHVHGHWAGAKQDPVVQSRCIGCAKLGFFVLSVDAFGAGERGIGKKLGEYHGAMTAATLLPVGLPLAGLQVYENKRAVDYLLTRPEVDPQRIGITGASGGGNQTMYAGAIDDRLACVVPTCSVGTYQAYLSAACCLCELVPGGLRITEEGDILGLAANRGLMVTSATKDAFQFSVGEARKSFSRLEAIARLFPAAKVLHTIVESPHAYNQPMREAMYGWMTLYLKGEGDGLPIPDPIMEPDDPELLRCFPGTTRPDDFITIPKFAAAEAERLASLRTIPSDRTSWESRRVHEKNRLIELLGGLPDSSPLNLSFESNPAENFEDLTFEVEPGLISILRRDLSNRRMALVLDLDLGSSSAWSSEIARGLRNDGWSVVAPELRATGRFAVARDKIQNAVDHNSAEWAIWIGRPLVGQWVADIRRSLDALAERVGSLPTEIQIVGKGSSGTVALFAAALDERITRAKIVNSISGYATDQPYQDLRLGVVVPGILRDFGDIPDVAALIAPRQLTIVGGTTGAGMALNRVELLKQFVVTRTVFKLLESPDSFEAVNE